MQYLISVITVTFNASQHLPNLIESLYAQSDSDFEWIIVDGASTDGTVEVIKSANDVVTKWLSEPDFGIYHAMNKALQIATGEFYLVLGADDRLTPEAIAQYKNHAKQAKADILTAKIIRDGRVEKRKPCWPWLYAHHAFVSEHSVGSLIRRSLHEKFGLYSKRYPIGADLLFLKRACLAPETKIVHLDFIAGIFGFTGRSRNDRAGAICDYFRGQFETEKFKYLQIFLFALKVLKNAPEMVKAVTKKS